MLPCKQKQQANTHIKTIGKVVVKPAVWLCAGAAAVSVGEANSFILSKAHSATMLQVK